MAKNKSLKDADELSNLNNFDRQRNIFEKMRKTGGIDPSGESSDLEGYNVKISSKEKLDKLEDDIHPIDEMGEIMSDFEKS